MVIKVTQILEEKKQALAGKQKTREAQLEPDVLVGMCPTAQVISLFLLGIAFLTQILYSNPTNGIFCARFAAILQQLEQEERAKLKERTAAYEKDSLVTYDLMHLQCPCGIF